MEKSNFRLEKMSAGISYGIIFAAIGIPASIFFWHWPPSIELFFSVEILRVLKITVLQAGISSIISVCAGIILGALLFYFFKIPSALRSTLRLSFCMPSSLAAFCWLAILPRNFAYSLSGIIFVHCWLNAPWIALKTIETLEWSNRSAKEAAYAIGARVQNIFQFIDFPILAPLIKSQLFQTFIICASSFSVIMILGSGTGIQSLETSMYESIRFGLTNWNAVSSLALWQCVLSIGMGFLLVRNFERPSQIEDRFIFQNKNIKKQKIILSICLFVFLITIIYPYFISILNGWTFIPKISENFDSLFISFKISFITATFTTLFAVFFILGKNKRLVNAISLLSVSFLSVTWLVALSFFADPFSNPVLMICLIQSIGLLPFAFHALWPLKAQSQNDNMDAARALGARKIKIFFFIEWTRWRSAILSLWFMIAGMSLGEMAATSFFSLNDPLPLILKIKTLQSHYKFDQADGTLAFLLIVITLLLFTGEKLREK